MTARDFCFWLQGYFEVVAANPAPAGGLTPSQASCVERHLALVFAHDIDPQAGGPESQAKLNIIHKKDATGHTPRC